jgi:hypothetical protein
MAKFLQASVMKACFQIAERSQDYVKSWATFVAWELVNNVKPKWCEMMYYEEKSIDYADHACL